MIRVGFDAMTLYAEIQHNNPISKQYPMLGYELEILYSHQDFLK